MAIYNHEEGFTPNERKNVAEEANGVKDLNSTRSENTFGMGSGLLNTLRTGLVSAGGITVSLQELKDEAEKIIKSKTGNNDANKVVIIDNSIIKESYYSLLVFYRNYPERKLTKYYIMLLARTNRRSLTAKETLAKTVAVRAGNMEAKKELFTYTDAFDKYLFGIIHNAIKVNDSATSQEGWKFQSLDGYIIPYETDPIKVIETVTVNALNAFTISDYQERGEGLNIVKLKESVGNNILFKYDFETHPEGTITDSLGNVIKADFTARFKMVNLRNEDIRSINVCNRDDTLVSTSGYVTGIPVTVNRVNPVTRVNETVNVISPHIVLTNIRTEIPDTASMLLGLIAGSLVGHRKQYIKVILDCMSPDRNPGYYNILTKDVVNPKDNTPMPILDLVTSKYDDNQKARVIDQLFSGPVVVSVDTTPFGEGYLQQCSLDLCSLKPAAKNEIIEGLTILTNGQMSNFDGNIVVSRNQIPYGHYQVSKGKGVRDNRDIELATILKYVTDNGSDETPIRMYFGSLAPNNPDSFDIKMELLANMLPDAYIDGKTNRVTINPLFLQGLVSATQNAGLIAQMDTIFSMINTGFNLEALNQYADFGLSPDFGNMGIIKTMNQGPNDQRRFNMYTYGHDNRWYL